MQTIVALWFAVLLPLSTVAAAVGADVGPAAAPRPQSPLRPGESVRETRDPFPGTEPKDHDGNDTVWCVRIVDAVDRRPIAGALVQVPWHPGGGVADQELHFQCAGRADADGWVRLPWPAVYGYRDYVFADAPGYAATEHCYPGQEECVLQRGTDVPVQLVDYTGRPVPNGRIELVLGCGHVPVQRSVLADAEGRATLPAIEPTRHEDFFVWAEGCDFGAFRLRSTWRAGDPPVAIDVVPGTSATGRVVDRSGAPVAGARVGQFRGARPWGITGLDGRFHLIGLGKDAILACEPPPHLGLPAVVFDVPPPGVELTLALGEPEPTGLLAVRTSGPDARPADDIRVTLVRDGDGFTVTETTDDDGEATLAVPPGRYRVLADGNLGPFGRSATVVEVGAAPAFTLTVPVPRSPTVRVDASRIQGMTFGITTASAFRQLDPEEADGHDVPVPQGERATFRISTWEDGELLVRFVDVPPPGAVVVLDGPPVGHLRGRCVGPDGAPMAAELTVKRQAGTFDYSRVEGDVGGEARAEVEVATRLVGTVTWTATPKDPALLPLHGDARLAAGGDVDLGTLRFQAPRTADLQLVLPDELKGRGGTVSVACSRQNGFVWSRIDGDDRVATGLSQVVEGDRLLIQLAAPGALPLRFRAPGPPPWTIPWPKATLRLVARSAGGKSLAKAVLIVDGVVLREPFASGEPLTLTGVAAGAHMLVVAEAGHVGKVLRLVIEDGEARALEVELQPSDG